jgi:hypothetical protein
MRYVSKQSRLSESFEGWKGLEISRDQLAKCQGVFDIFASILI